MSLATASPSRAVPSAHRVRPNREGVYTYSYAGGQLKFTAVDDLCFDRRNMLTATAWLREQ